MPDAPNWEQIAKENRQAFLDLTQVLAADGVDVLVKDGRFTLSYAARDYKANKAVMQEVAEERAAVRRLQHRLRHLKARISAFNRLTKTNPQKVQGFVTTVVDLREALD